MQGDLHRFVGDCHGSVQCRGEHGRLSQQPILLLRRSHVDDRQHTESQRGQGGHADPGSAHLGQHGTGLDHPEPVTTEPVTEPTAAEPATQQTSDGTQDGRAPLLPRRTPGANEMPGKPIEQTDGGGGWFTKDPDKS